MIARQIVLVARGVWLEAIRRKEIYVIVAVSCLFILGLSQLRFFGLADLSKFYREVALKIMGSATALTVIVLGSRQLPREFESRTIYPLLARPIHRITYLCGKQLGVMAAGTFCLALFLGLYVAGCLLLGAPIYPMLLMQHVFLQLCMLLILTSLCFLLSVKFSLDSAITFGFLYYLVSSILSNLFLMLYEATEGTGRIVINGLTWILPQFVLFDLSEKNVHGDVWEALPAAVMGQLFLYAMAFTTVYLVFTLLVFRRKPL
jgi:ABC-type transport system involved in multi-copper enzyme maturation permease subunit